MGETLKRRLSEYRIFRYLWPHKWLVLSAFAVDAVCRAAEVRIALQTKPILDALENAKSGMDAAQAAVFWAILKESFFIIAGLAVVDAIFGFGKIYLGRYIAYRIDYDLRNDLCQHMLGLSMSFFNEKRDGELLSGMTNDIATANQAILLSFDVISSSIALLMLFAGSWYLHPALAIALLFIAPVIWFPSMKYRNKIRKASADRLAKLADLTQDMAQLLTGIRTVKAFRMEQQEIEEFRSIGAGVLRKSMKATRAKAISNSLTSFISRFGSALIMLGVGYVLVFKVLPTLRVSDLITFVGLIGMSYTSIKALAKDYTGLQEYLPASERLFGVFDINPEINDHRDAVPLKGVRNSITFRDVEFGYNGVPVLKGINLDVKAGTIIAVVGHSGAGKSTMLDLIPRFYDPQHGAIEIDGTDIRRITRDSLLAHIAIVGQQPFLFNTTIAENVRYGRRAATMAQVVQAATAANIHDFIVSQPEGYDAVVGDQGVRLSGGQRQRLTIARAILKNAPILLLDEATSSLDTESEKLVQAGLSNLMENRTTFVIAHRLSTVQHADRIIVLRDGRIVEQGRHDELLALNGEYARLYQSQISTEQDGQS